MRCRRHAHGFTLVELLIALFAMSLLALMSWRGLDGMVRVQQQTQARADEVLSLQVGLAQWVADLDALVEMPQINALDWNGRVLRLTRRGTGSVTEGVRVVGWTRRVSGGTSQWLRWQSPPLTTRGEVALAWQRADAWSKGPGDQERLDEVAVVPLADWQIFYFRDNAWTNPQSSDAMSGRVPLPIAVPPQVGPRVVAVPDGVRLILLLPPGHAITGELVRDWARPTLGGGR